MPVAIESPIKAWESFYIIVGSTAGALTGLQFVVLTLVAEAGAPRGRRESVSAFGSPTIVHFCVALLVASILSAPWKSLLHAGVAVGGCGAFGVVYCAVVWRRALRQRSYKPVFEDWIWYTMLPAIAYSTLLIAGMVLGAAPTTVLFAIAAAALSLVLVGIHNAWDTVMYVTLDLEGPGSETVASDTGAGANKGAGPPETPVSRAPGPV